MNTKSLGLPFFKKYLALAGLALLGTSIFLLQVVYASSTSVLERASKETTPIDENALQSVYPLADKTVIAKEQFQGGSFRVLTRKDKIERYKCSTCHNDKPVVVRQGGVLTHNITINHGSLGNELTCIDCHREAERDYLEDKKGRKIDFDHSYQLCGQCHFRQKRDWIGGAHGKRVTYWAGPRVVNNCATCHNPHSPRFEKRFPATYSKPLN